MPKCCRIGVDAMSSRHIDVITTSISNACQVNCENANASFFSVKRTKTKYHKMFHCQRHSLSCGEIPKF